MVPSTYKLSMSQTLNAHLATFSFKYCVLKVLIEKHKYNQNKQTEVTVEPW